MEVKVKQAILDYLNMALPVVRRDLPHDIWLLLKDAMDLYDIDPNIILNHIDVCKEKKNWDFLETELLKLKEEMKEVHAKAEAERKARQEELKRNPPKIEYKPAEQQTPELSKDVQERLAAQAALQPRSCLDVFGV